MNLAANFQALQEDCSLINQIPTKYLARFCKMAVKSIIDGENAQQIGKAAKSLEQDEEVIKNTVRGLAQILTMLASASVYVVSKKIYKETLLPIQLTEEASNGIYEYYQNVHHTLRDVLRQFKIETSRYHAFDWRLDIQTGSRALHRRVDPVYVCQLQTSNNKQSNHIDTDQKESENTKDRT
eukprot:371728_1